MKKNSKKTETQSKFTDVPKNVRGLHAQVSALRPEDLQKAKKDPDAYRDLRVRITGYSGVFVDLCETLQDDVIERFK